MLLKKNLKPATEKDLLYLKTPLVDGGLGFMLIDSDGTIRSKRNTEKLKRR